MTMLSRSGAVAALVCVLIACDRPAVAFGASTQATNGANSSATTTEQPSQQNPDNTTVSVMVDHVSYRHDRSMEYTLLDLRKNPPQAIGGAIVDRLSSGGEKSCCVSLPKVWRPGINMRVIWSESDRERIYPDKYVRDIEVPKYDQASDLYVVFYPKHKVELVVSVGEPGSPLWQGKVKETPWEQCVREHGRKTCKRAIPNYGGLSPAELQGVCTSVKERNDDPKYCTWAMELCMRDFEDRDFCDKTLWGKPRDSK